MGKICDRDLKNVNNFRIFYKDLNQYIEICFRNEVS